MKGNESNGKGRKRTRKKGKGREGMRKERE